MSRLSFLLAMSTCVSVADAAEPQWLKLQAPRFGVVSELSAEDTRRWAVEFDQFIDALHQLYSVDEVELPPLTIVLFEQSRAFEPYHLRTVSGRQADVAGFFSNLGTWSVIGMAGRRVTVETRQLIYHEAVHWFASANEVESPMWFEEGLAEVFSTFIVQDGKGRWGQPLQDHVDYLAYVGLEPMDEFLRATQDEALHESITYYPQAWAFVHYLLFGNNGAERSKLTEFLRQVQQTDLDRAFDRAFDESYADMTAELRNYLRRGSYSMALLEVQDRGREMAVEPATRANVEFALARLALAGNNTELAQRHVDAVIGIAPTVPQGFELRALLAQQADDTQALNAALDRAIELGSQDAYVYTTKGFEILEGAARQDAPIDGTFDPDVARTAADLFDRAIMLRPRTHDAYEGLVTALLNTDVVTEQDETVLAIGRRAFPTDGLVLVGQAAVERQRGNVPEAARMLRLSRTEPFTLPTHYRAPLSGLHDFWLLEWLATELGALAVDGRFTEGQALLDAQLADVSLTGRAREQIAKMKADYAAYERLTSAANAGKEGREDEARALLRELVNDPGLSENIRRDAQRMLDEHPE